MSRAGVLVAIALAACAPRADVADGGDPVRRVQVTGSGVASAPPNQARLRVGFSIADKRAEIALAKVSVKTDALVASLGEIDVPLADVATVDYRLAPEPIVGPDGEPTGETRYRMTQTFEVLVRDLKQLPFVVGRAGEAGVDRIDDVRFSVAHVESVVERAREGAMEDARAKAETLAQSVGLRLGHALEIKELSGGEAPVPRLATVRGPTLPGGMFEERVDVQVAFALVEP